MTSFPTSVRANTPVVAATDSARHDSVTLLPLVSWVTPGNVSPGGLLRPSLHWCRQHLGWWPGIVVADMGYLSAESKQAARTGWQCAVITRLRADMKLVPPDVSAEQMCCPQGQPLEWWEHDAATGTQWFRVRASGAQCAWCVRGSNRRSRSRKNRLGLGRRFLNSLRLTWQISLLAECAMLLRTMAWLDEPQPDGLLSQLQPHQMEFDLHLEKFATPENPQITHKSS